MQTKQKIDIAGAIAAAIAWLSQDQPAGAAINHRGLWMPGTQEIAGRRIIIQFCPIGVWGRPVICFKVFDFDSNNPYRTGFTEDLVAACSAIVCDAVRRSRASVRAQWNGDRGTRSFSVSIEAPACAGPLQLLKEYHEGCPAHGDPGCRECDGWLSEKYRRAILPEGWK